MKRTIAGFFDSSRHASAAVDDLLLHNYSRDQISILANETERKLATTHDVVDVLPNKPERAEKGAMLGGFAGLLVGLAAVLIPGIGPLLALGPAATALVSAGLGAAAGGLLGGLTKMGISHDEAQLYVEGMRRGGTLVLVEAPVEKEPEVLSIFKRHSAVDMGERVKHYHATGYKGPDITAKPFTQEQVLAERKQHISAAIPPPLPVTEKIVTETIITRPLVYVPVEETFSAGRGGSIRERAEGFGSAVRSTARDASDRVMNASFFKDKR